MRIFQNQFNLAGIRDRWDRSENKGRSSNGITTAKISETTEIIYGYIKPHVQIPQPSKTLWTTPTFTEGRKQRKIHLEWRSKQCISKDSWTSRQYTQNAPLRCFQTMQDQMWRKSQRIRGSARARVGTRQMGTNCLHIKVLECSRTKVQH